MHCIVLLILCLRFMPTSCRGIPRYDDDDGFEDAFFDSNTFYNDKEALYKLPENGKLFEGDIVMDDRLRRAVWGESSKKSAVKGLKASGLLWPRGVIPYIIDDKFPLKSRIMLAKAMNEFETRTCIRFVKRSGEKNYVIYTAKKDECSSSIGMGGGEQIINLGTDCLVLGTFEHENMHALGFIHEHSRPDRDDYIKVKYDNIKKEEWGNFQKYSMDEIDNLKEDFNFASVLLYRNDAFSKNGGDTLASLDDPGLVFGQRIKFSVGDVKEINKLYNCTRYEKDPNYHGLFREYHVKKRKKDLFRKRIIDKLLEIERTLKLDELEEVY